MPNALPVVKTMASVLLPALALSGCQRAPEGSERASNTAPPQAPIVKAAPTAEVSSQDITDAYLYLLGRLLVLRQQRIDFEKEGFQWNKAVYREPGGVAWANPNLDVAYTEAWIAVDEKTCVQLDVPKVPHGRYYTWHMLNGWGETVLNINERTYAQHPSGRFALCLKGATATVPSDALRVDLPAKTTRVLARVELGADPKEALRLQRAFKLTPLGQPKIDAPIQVPLFENQKLPRAEAFDVADAVLAGEADINPGMEDVRRKLAAVAALAKTDAGRSKVDAAIESQAWPAFKQMLMKPGPEKNGWVRPAIVGNYASDYRARTYTNYVGIWANSSSEATYFGNSGLDGSAVHTQTFPADALPKDKVRYFWSVIAVDGKEYRVIPNPLKRYLINKQSRLQYAKDGSLTFVYAPKQPRGVPQGNWLPTPEGQKYNLTFRFYGTSEDIAAGRYFPPPLVRKN